ncbi:MAG TPA: endo-1,3-alpha-glucanase family glycosylhydrolase, partial [Armatimonadota bacterium]|nr:endo-1,3-alpha-glucanase family glycosylhydrolase [Armatimonadota bacterium]
DSTLSGKPMRRFDAGQLVDNAVCFGQSGEKIRAMTDWDIPNLPYSADGTAANWQIAVTPLTATDTAVTKVNFCYRYNGHEVVYSDLACNLTFPVSLAFVTYLEKPMNGQSVTLSNLRSYQQPVGKPVDGKSVTVNDHCVWCHYVAWHEWNQTPTAVTNYYDFPMAYPTGDQQKDYRQEIDAALHMGINGFFVDLVNGSSYSDQTIKLLDAARGTPFMVSVCLDGFTDSEAVLAEKVATLLRRAGNYPNLARVDGKPLLSTYSSGRRPDDYWMNFRKELANRGFQVFLVADGISREKAPNCFDMLYNFGALDGMSSAAATRFPQLADVAKSTTISGKWMAGVSPGYVGSWPFNGRNDYYNGFRGIDQFWTNWETAVKQHADWIHLTTWNDLDETPLQPMTFQFHTYPELTRYWIDQWQGTVKPAATPRLYLAYQREQLLGTVQRVELVSLPTVAASITASLEMRDMAGKTLVTLPALTFSGQEALRREWAVPTAAFAQTPIVEPVLHVKAGTLNYTRRLPCITLRTGWIANKTCVRVPVHEMSDGMAQVKVTKDATGALQAALTLKSPDTIRKATIWRNDRPIGYFTKTAPSGVLYHLGFTYLQDTDIKMTVTNGSFVNAYYTLDTPEKHDFTWSATSFAVHFGRYRYLTAELLDSGNAALAVSVGNATPQTVTLADLRQGPIELRTGSGQAACRLFLAEVDSMAVTAPALDLTQGTLNGRWYTHETFPNDLFYVRCETADGRYFYSNTVAPFSTATPAVPTTILQTAETLDGGGVGGGGFTAYFTPPPFTTPKSLLVKVHPAMVQQMQWTFDGADGWGDTRGWNALHPGSSSKGSFYAADAKRLPTLQARQDAPGRCAAFDGIDDVAEIPIRQMPLGSFTISLDVCPDGNGGQEQAIIGHGGWQSCPVLRILADGRLQGGREMAKQENDVQHNLLVTSESPLPKGVWSHIELTFNEQTMQLFVNGKSVAMATGEPARTYGNLRIFLGGDSAGHPFQGKLDNVLISSVAQP